MGISRTFSTSYRDDRIITLGAVLYIATLRSNLKPDPATYHRRREDQVYD